jgi:aminopeptidase
VIMNNETQVRRGRADVRFPMAPPRNLHQAMVASDEVIIVTNLEWANRFAHVSAVKETCAANGKIASVEEGMGTWDLTVEDIERATQRARDAIAALDGKKHVRVTTPIGTDLTVSIDGRPALEVTPIKKRGQMMGPVPLWAEVAFAAVEDFTHGTGVVDGVMLGIGLPGQVEKPIHWTFEGGRCVKIEGAAEAERLRRAIDGVENADVAGEFAFGTSEKAPFGSPSEKGRIGTVHIALGDNHNAYPGGQNVSSLHLDGVFLNATMWIEDDGTYILRDGEWVLP